MSAARTGPCTLAEMMAQALVIERAAVERYNALADVMEVHNNREVTDLFRKMAQIETRHVEQIVAQMGWKDADAAPAPGAWADIDTPECVPEDEIHYLMWPWHALQLALAAEQRAEAFYTRLAETATADAIRRAALDLREEERWHVSLVRGWLERTPEPGTDWADDPDPPRYTD
ncbi:MAG: ferritin family protein [Caldimonas sp.]